MHPSDPGTDLEQLAQKLSALKAEGKRVVHCHGVFDLLHIGHIKHLKAARALGDVLVVTVTPDRFVNKGPHRPAFAEQYRVEALAGLECVDFVAVNRWPTAVETIALLKPDVFVKGKTEDKGPRDHTDAIVKEEEAVLAVGGRMVLTEEDTFSASALINRHIDVFPPETKAFLDEFRGRYTADDVVDVLTRARGLRVLTVGEAIIDEYEFCQTMNKANKDPILAAESLFRERYAGGILAIANHAASFFERVGVLTFLGELDSLREFVEAHCNPAVARHFFTKSDSPTIVKLRYLEEYMAVKLFEIYKINNEPLSGDDEDTFCRMLEDILPSYDVVVVADYGHGLFTDRSIALLCERAKFLAVNTQLNAGNRGFNLISKYPRADYLTIDEPEARLEVRSRKTEAEELVRVIAERVACPRMMLTRGKKGSMCYDAKEGLTTVPAFGYRVVDRIGAGDAVLAVTAPVAALGVPMQLVGFVGNVAGAEACQIMGNKRAIEASSLFRHITSLLQ